MNVIDICLLKWVAWLEPEYRNGKIFKMDGLYTYDLKTKKTIIF